MKVMVSSLSFGEIHFSRRLSLVLGPRSGKVRTSSPFDHTEAWSWGLAAPKEQFPPLRARGEGGARAAVARSVALGETQCAVSAILPSDNVSSVEKGPSLC